MELLMSDYVIPFGNKMFVPPIFTFCFAVQSCRVPLKLFRKYFASDEIASRFSQLTSTNSLKYVPQRRDTKRGLSTSHFLQGLFYQYI